MPSEVKPCGADTLIEYARVHTAIKINWATSQAEQFAEAMEVMYGDMAVVEDSGK